MVVVDGPFPNLHADGPLEVVAAETLFRTTEVRHRSFGSLARLDGGRLLLAFRLGSGPDRRNDGVVMLSHSDDAGRSWTEPMPLYAHPGWDCLLMGGLAPLPGGVVRLVIGRVKLDFSLGGDEPLSDWYVTAIDSGDGGRSWSEPAPEIRLFPCWTELYGASNPHPLADGRLLWAVMGTTGRDRGWRAGVVFSDGEGQRFTSPVIIAAGAGREYGDIDVVRLADGRLLAVIREFVARDSVCAWSEDDGRTWSPVRPTGFQGANIKLLRLRSGGIVCAYRDEDPARPGVSVSVSDDGGERWRFAGQLYAADPAAARQPGSPCGYPDLVYLSDDELLCIFHTEPDGEGRVDLHLLRLRDRSARAGADMLTTTTASEATT